MNFDTEVIMQAYELADGINSSAEVLQYKQFKGLMDIDPEVKELTAKLKKQKIQFEEVKRFGNFHPDYNQIKSNIDKLLKELKTKDSVKKFLKAEEELNELLYLVSRTLASSISESINVPKNSDLFADDSCITGTCSSCGIKDGCAI